MTVLAAEDPRIADDVVQCRARAIVQHERVMAEAAEVARIAAQAQARARASAAPIRPTGDQPAAVRKRVDVRRTG